MVKDFLKHLPGEPEEGEKNPWSNDDVKGALVQVIEGGEEVDRLVWEIESRISEIENVIDDREMTILLPSSFSDTFSPFDAFPPLYDSIKYIKRLEGLDEERAWEYKAQLLELGKRVLIMVIDAIGDQKIDLWAHLDDIIEYVERLKELDPEDLGSIAECEAQLSRLKKMLIWEIEYKIDAIKNWRAALPTSYLWEIEKYSENLRKIDPDSAEEFEAQLPELRKKVEQSSS